MLSINFPYMFVGEREVEKVDGTTVHFKDGGQMEYSEKALSYILSEESQTDSDLQMITVVKVAEDILKVFEEHNVRLFDVNSILQRVKWSCDSFNDKAMAKVAGLQNEFEGITDKQIRNVRVSHLNNFLNS